MSLEKRLSGRKFVTLGAVSLPDAEELHVRPLGHVLADVFAWQFGGGAFVGTSCLETEPAALKPVES